MVGSGLCPQLQTMRLLLQAARSGVAELRLMLPVVDRSAVCRCVLCCTS